MKKFVGITLTAMLALGCALAVFAEDRPEWAQKDPAEVGDTVVLYSTLDDPQQAMIEDLWYAQYPDCKIEWVTDSVGKLIARARSEASDPYADCIYGGMFETDGTTNQDVLQPYTSSIADQVSTQDPYGYYTMNDIQYVAFIVNDELAEELGVEINSYEDLLQPELKGKIIIGDPAVSSSAYHQFFNILAVMGDELADDKAWDYLDQLIVQCDGVITDSSSQVFKDVIAGEYVVGLSYENIIEMQITLNGAEGVSLVYPEEGNTGVASGVAMVKDCPHQAAAEAIVDLAASAEYQQGRSEYCCARGTNTTISYGNYPSAEEINAVDIDYEALGLMKEELLEKWADHWDEFAP